LNNCGNALMELKKFDDALANYEAALEVYADFTDACAIVSDGSRVQSRPPPTLLFAPGVTGFLFSPESE
jgi:hypothetical protein